MKIFVANIPFHLNGDGIRQLFELFGPVNSVKIITENNGKSKGFGFLEMENDEQGKRAMLELNGVEIDGRSIIVHQAEQQSESVKIHKRPRIAH